MLNLYFVRHGQTEWNVAKKIQGRKDSKLTEQGLKHVEKLRDHLIDFKWTAVYSSPSKRALKTTEIIIGSQSFHSINKDERLMEMHLGDWEGMTMQEIENINAKQHHYYWEKPSQFLNETGESFGEVKERVEAFIHDLLLNYESGNILIVTHGVVIKMVQLIGNQLGMDMLWKTPYIEGTSLTKLKVENKILEVQLEGDLAHLN